MEYPDCNLCGASKGRPLYANTEASFVMCGDCSLVYMSPRRTREEYAHLYTEEYQNDRHAVRSYKDAVERLRKKSSYRIKEEHVKRYILPYVSADKKVLEIGSGWGTMLRVIKDLSGADVSGIEASALGAQVAHEYYGLPVENTTFEAYIEKPRGKFDTIVMFHVLEHFLDPHGVLVSVRELLTPTGALFVAVPNVASPNEAPERFFQKHHTYYFSPFTLEALARKAGFRVARRWFTGFDMEYVFVPDVAEEVSQSGYRALTLRVRIEVYLLAARCYSILRNFAPRTISDFLKSFFKKIFV